MWNLEGILYLPNINRKIEIEIVRIGGGALSFCVNDTLANKIPYGTPLIIKILFEDKAVEITGNITKIYDFGPYKYFDYYYTDIPDSKRDFIFRQLFKNK